MTSEHLRNLEKIGQLLQEPFLLEEFKALLSSANNKLNDSKNQVLSFDSRFDLTYNAAHALALAALRTYGYRSDKRYLVFQCLQHTLEIPKAKILLLAKFHDKRNLAEYEGEIFKDELFLKEVSAIVDELVIRVESLEAR